MANLKDINYGIGKYLELSDASDLPAIGANRKNLDLLNFKVTTNNAYALYNFKDGMIDAYQTETGVDASTSTNEIYDSSGKYYSGSEVGTVTGNDSYTKLLLHADGSNGGTTFTDSSSSGRSVTAGGDVHTDTTIKKIGTASAQFDGTGDYLQMADSADFNYGSGDFTIDFWCYCESFGNYFYNQESGSNWLRMEQKSEGIEFNCYNNGSYSTGWATVLPWTSGDIQDSWHHIALERDGTVMRGYVDGTEITMSNGTEPGSNTMPDISSVLWLGGKVSGSGYFEGYLDEFRISKGIVRYDANFTPESRAGYGEAYAIYNNMTLVSNTQTANAEPDEGRLTIYEEASTGSITLDTDLKGYVSRDNGSTYTQTLLTDDGFLNPTQGIDGYTKLMLNCDGANDGTTFTDSSLSPITVTSAGGAHTDTAIKKFGTASAQFDGSDDYLILADNDDLEPEGGDFTLDFWMYPLSNNRFAMWAGSTDWWWGLDWYNQGTRNLCLWASSNGSSWDLINADASGNGIGGITMALDTWQHCMVVRNGNNWITFIDGVKDIDITVSGTIINKAQDKWIGKWGSGSSLYEGYLDEIRWSKGIARQTAAFTPPTSPYASAARILSGSVDISGQPSGTNMKYKIETLNQSSSKICRLNGASLLWA